MNDLNYTFCLMNFNFVLTFLIHISRFFNIDFNRKNEKDRGRIKEKGSHTHYTEINWGFGI